MPANLDDVLWGLDDDDAGAAPGPNVVVDPTIEAFCEVGPRAARGTAPPPTESGRLRLAAILQFMSENSDGENAD